jgi:hypothetical protein
VPGQKLATCSAAKHDVFVRFRLSHAHLLIYTSQVRFAGMVAEATAGPGWRQGPCPSPVCLLWSSLGLQVRLDEPQPYVDAARHCREQVSRVQVSQFVGLPESFSCRLAERHQGDDSASTWLRSSAVFAGYSASELRFATRRAVPSATPPSCTIRSAVSST